MWCLILTFIFKYGGGCWKRGRWGKKKKSQREKCVLGFFKVTETDELINMPQKKKLTLFPHFVLSDIFSSLTAWIQILTPPLPQLRGGVPRGQRSSGDTNTSGRKSVGFSCRFRKELGFHLQLPSDLTLTEEWGCGGAARRAELRHNLPPLTLLSEQTGRPLESGGWGGHQGRGLPMGLWLKEFDTSVSSRFRNL